jgi:hypothetical protein
MLRARVPEPPPAPPRGARAPATASSAPYFGWKSTCGTAWADSGASK